MGIGEAMPFRQRGENLVLVGDEHPSFVGSRPMRRRRAIGEHQQRHRLVFLSDRFDDRAPRQGPSDGAVKPMRTSLQMAKLHDFQAAS